MHAAIISQATGPDIVSLSHPGDVKNALNNFVEIADIVMEVLGEVAKVHPFVQAAVFAFQFVIRLEIDRQVNDEKVKLIHYEMMQMMSAIFRLRGIREPDVLVAEGLVLRDRIKPLIDQFATDIRECGAFCDLYLKKSLASRLLKSKLYEQRLADFITTFTKKRSDLNEALTHFTAHKVNDIALEVKDMKDMLEKLFRKLDTPREEDALGFINESGGPEFLTAQEDLVRMLVKKTGESIRNIIAEEVSGQTDIATVADAFKKELKEDSSAFEEKVKIQTQNMAESISRAISAGAHDKLEDEDLKRLWQEMKWRGSVKGKHFAFGLYDYFTDQFSTGDTTPNAPKWSRKYFDKEYHKDILAAIDLDGSGYVTIREANEFAARRPDGWSLPAWFAFWARGWEMTVSTYRDKIFGILQRMHEQRDIIIKENIYYTDAYLECLPISATRSFLQSLSKPAAIVPKVSKYLETLSLEYMVQEETRLSSNLGKIGYNLPDNTESIKLIIGARNMEHVVLPLLYLILERHVRVFEYATQYEVDAREFPSMFSSLNRIFDLVKERLEKKNSDSKDINFALGMFRNLQQFMDGSVSTQDLFWKSDTKTPSCKMTEVSLEAKPIFYTHLNAPQSPTMKKRWLPYQGSDYSVTHKNDHLIMKSHRYLHPYSMHLIFKEALKRAAFDTQHLWTAANSDSSDECICYSCKKAVQAPVWICIECARGTYICDDCESHPSEPCSSDDDYTNHHLPRHHILRVYPSTPYWFNALSCMFSSHEGTPLGDFGPFTLNNIVISGSKFPNAHFYKNNIYTGPLYPGSRHPDPDHPSDPDDLDPDSSAKIGESFKGKIEWKRLHDGSVGLIEDDPIRNGNFKLDYADIQPARKRKDKYKDLPPELLDQWELDRQRKAERKHERELEKLIAATEPLTRKKGGKKGRKTMMKASSLDPSTINLGPNRIIDLTTLTQQIRRFVNDLSGPQTMSLPPANKETRKNVHELALTFGLKSISKGKGDARYTTLSKTSRSGIGRIDEWKVQKVLRRAGERGARGDLFGEFEDRKKGRIVLKHREGDEVGGTAPKIGEGNIGFKMLAAMGWSEGSRIGLSGGLDVPLVAIIKHSKLGLRPTLIPSTSSTHEVLRILPTIDGDSFVTQTLTSIYLAALFLHCYRNGNYINTVPANLENSYHWGWERTHSTDEHSRYTHVYLRTTPEFMPQVIRHLVYQLNHPSPPLPAPVYYHID
ncbi:hypothetical protein NP233_g11301 [Leucocoprinus birnbaumii]|uniref:Protein SQS1 n=1 Tax=Leucocoprinus birnbaumii TaxID=56174 RepID=A0AAD5VKI3_9AGAR|nr:hypothetical protein NP233_g11301 [Leucocoprinus birnbaumii]